MTDQEIIIRKVISGFLEMKRGNIIALNSNEKNEPTETISIQQNSFGSPIFVIDKKSNIHLSGETRNEVMPNKALSILLEKTIEDFLRIKNGQNELEKFYIFIEYKCL